MGIAAFNGRVAVLDDAGNVYYGIWEAGGSFTKIYSSGATGTCAGAVTSITFDYTAHPGDLYLTMNDTSLGDAVVCKVVAADL
jgi:hypothetical protein